VGLDVKGREYDQSIRDCSRGGLSCTKLEYLLWKQRRETRGHLKGPFKDGEIGRLDGGTGGGLLWLCESDGHGARTIFWV